MINEKIEAVAMRLNEFAGRVSEEDWELVKALRAELFDAAAQAQELESHVTLPALERELASPKEDAPCHTAA